MGYPTKVYVYTLRHGPTGKIYVGRSADPKRRIRSHLAHLRAGTHPVEDFQADFDKYGGPIIDEVLDEISGYSERRKEREWQQKLRTLDRRYGYNYKELNCIRGRKPHTYRTNPNT